MLVLSRKTGESIILDNNIRVTVVSIQGGRVRLGIEAPAGVPVHRKEIHDALVSEQASGVTRPAPGRRRQPA